MCGAWPRKLSGNQDYCKRHFVEYIQSKDVTIIEKRLIKSGTASKNAVDLMTRIQLVTRMGIQHVSVVLSWSNCIIFVAALKATLIDATQRFLNEFKMQFAQFLGCSHICICNEKSWLVGVSVLKAPLREPTADLTINMFLDLLATSTNNI